MQCLLVVLVALESGLKFIFAGLGLGLGLGKKSTFHFHCAHLQWLV